MIPEYKIEIITYKDGSSGIVFSKFNTDTWIEGDDNYTTKVLYFDMMNEETKRKIVGELELFYKLFKFKEDE